MSVTIGTVETFADVQPDKAQAVKVLEEAAEVFSAWQIFDDALAERKSYEDNPDLLDIFAINMLKAECCDLIQATCNLLAALGVEDITHEMRVCKVCNEERGRAYEC